MPHNGSGRSATAPIPWPPPKRRPPGGNPAVNFCGIDNIRNGAGDSASDRLAQVLGGRR
jgi:hypothetical protein